MMTREKAIEMCKSIKDYLTAGNPVWSKEEVAEAMTMAIEALKGRPKGHWEYEKINSYSERTYCSECGSHAPIVYVHDDHYGRLAHGEIRKTKYCPWCGADMRGDNND